MGKLVLIITIVSILSLCVDARQTQNQVHVTKYESHAQTTSQNPYDYTENYDVRYSDGRSVRKN